MKFMTRFEVHFKDEIISASMDDKGVLVIAVIHTKNSTDLQIAGSIPEKSLTKHIEDIDKITIKNIEAEQNSETVNSCPNEDINAYLVGAYHFLKEKLMADGLL
jgi:hypothetical protein